MKIHFELIDSISEAKEKWEKLSDFNLYPSLFNDWNFRYCFYKYFNFPINFIAGFEGEKLVGLLPLQFNTDRNYLEFFGGSYMEDNQVFIIPEHKDKEYDFYDFMKNTLKKNYNLDDILLNNDKTEEFVFSENKYILDSNNFLEFNDYLEKKFNSKRRKNLRNDFKKILESQVNIIENNFEDIDLLIEYTNQSYEEESTFKLPYRKEIFNDLSKLTNVHSLSYIINGEKQGVSLFCLYENRYVFLAVGSNRLSYPNLGKYIIFENVKKAFSLNKVFDAGVGDCNWKEKMHFDTVAQYKISNIN